MTDCVRCWKYSLPLVRNLMWPPLLCKILRFPTTWTWTLTSYGKEPHQSVSKRGRAKQILPVEQTYNNKTYSNKMIMTNYATPVWQISEYNLVNCMSTNAKERPANNICAWRQTLPCKLRFFTAKMIHAKKWNTIKPLEEDHYASGPFSARYHNSWSHLDFPSVTSLASLPLLIPDHTINMW